MIKNAFNRVTQASKANRSEKGLWKEFRREFKLKKIIQQFYRETTLVGKIYEFF